MRQNNKKIHRNLGFCVFDLVFHLLLQLVNADMEIEKRFFADCFNEVTPSEIIFQHHGW